MTSIEEQIEIYARRIVNAAFPEVEGKLEQNVYCTRALRLLRKDLVIAAADSRRCPLCRRGHWHTDVLLEALQTIAKSSGPTDPSAQEIARQALRELAEIGLEALAKRDVDVLREPEKQHQFNGERMKKRSRDPATPHQAREKACELL